MPPVMSPMIPVPVEKLLSFRAQTSEIPRISAVVPASGSALPRSARRRASVEQGRALEVLGHAVEYLVDSRMFMLGEHNRAAETEGVQILMRQSRTVFAECREVVPLRVRLSRFALRQLR